MPAEAATASSPHSPSVSVPVQRQATPQVMCSPASSPSLHRSPPSSPRSGAHRRFTLPTRGRPPRTALAPASQHRPLNPSAPQPSRAAHAYLPAPSGCSACWMQNDLHRGCLRLA
ncbi:hypothetical protein PVAP13_9KG251200 [Panicum virgatum]|uniref:Uncharacterized protein n=1 Tax=Panicum virgatum TaxID=38727 RepID=A0A8T0NQF4_PANVG|nr:hypothetical protein PVAP13_9KG251200 [Panicum virgatum]